MIETYALAVIWDGLGNVSSYSLLLMISSNGNYINSWKDDWILIAAGVLCTKAARRFLTSIAPKSFHQAELSLLSQIIGLLGLECFILTAIKVFISFGWVYDRWDFIWITLHGM
jgi:hypothetical protein